MSLITFLPSSNSNCSVVATAPRVGQAKLTIAAASGSTPAPLFATLAAGTLPYAAGQIHNPGCAELRLTLTYLNGADCDSCTVDALGTASVVVIIPAKSVFPLPQGLITAATVESGATDAAGVFTASNVTKAQVVNWYSSYTPCCGDTVLVP